MSPGEGQSRTVALDKSIVKSVGELERATSQRRAILVQYIQPTAIVLQRVGRLDGGGSRCNPKIP